jgi:predicted glycoside hydrolase/deacetylase ChbG (UPF0249 family)
MVELEHKRVTICADDFGMNPGVDAGILGLAQLGRINAASCLVEGPSFKAGVAALAQSGLQLGLHLNFTESMGRPGLYLPISTLIVQSYLRRLDASRVYTQIAAQLDAFESALGRAPDFIDGHQHVHQFPQIRQALLQQLQRRYRNNENSSGPWLRCTRAGKLDGMPPRMRLKAHIIETLGAHAFSRLAKRMGFDINRRFLGVYDFQGGAAGYRRLLHAWLAQARDGDLIMCHPAQQALPGDGLGAQRRAEFDVLSSGETGAWLQQYGVVVERR